MKNSNRLLSVLLSAALLLTALTLPGSAANAYPESEHNYKNNADQTWEYVHPGTPEQLFVTFNEKTSFATSWIGYSYLEEGDITEEALRELAETGWYSPENDDRLYIYDSTGALYGSYTGSELSGVTLLLPGDRFTLHLITDGTGSDYGFAIDRISPEMPENTALVNYHLEDEVFPLAVPAGETVTLNPYYSDLRQYGDNMLVGWQTEDGRAWTYNPDAWAWEETETGIIAEPGAVYDLWPVWALLGMRAEEVYSFTNSDDNFDGGYYYTNHDYYRNIGNWMTTFGVTPFMPVAAAGLLVMTVYWPTLDFAGSCTGFPITEMLQHYGKIDLLSAQGASSLSELEPTDELTSIINVYNNNCVACHLVNNVALDPGSEGYAEQLKKLYETAEKGTPVYFEFYPGGEHPMKIIAEADAGSAVNFWNSGAHGILLTGAYTASDGTHVLIACDCNSTAYVNGGCDIVTINADFTEIDYHGTLNGFSWNDDVSQFDSFKLDGVSNPFAWHVAFFRHFFDTFRQILALFCKTTAAGFKDR